MARVRFGCEMKLRVLCAGCSAPRPLEEDSALVLAGLTSLVLRTRTVCSCGSDRVRVHSHVTLVEATNAPE
jgi:hypothetical protein